jgi:hypothetical protein
MLTGERSIAEEDRALQLVTELARAGAGPTLIRRLVGGLVGMPQISHRYRLVALDLMARGRDTAGSRPGAPPGITYMMRLPKDRAAVLARVLYLIHETGEAGFRKEGRGSVGWDSNRVRVELLLSAWAVLQHMASSGPAWMRESAADISFELLERAEHFVFREQAIGLAICPECGAVNLRRNTSYVLCCRCNRRIKGMLNLPVQEAEPRRALPVAA